MHDHEWITLTHPSPDRSFDHQSGCEIDLVFLARSARAQLERSEADL
jgi:hypothetical protein